MKYLDVLVGYLAALCVGIEPHGLELLFHPAHTGAENKTPAAEHVQRRQYLGGEDGVAIGQDEHVGAQPDPGGAAGQEVQRGQRFKVGVVPLEGRHSVSGVGIEG